MQKKEISDLRLKNEILVPTGVNVEGFSIGFGEKHGNVVLGLHFMKLDWNCGAMTPYTCQKIKTYNSWS